EIECGHGSGRVRMVFHVADDTDHRSPVLFLGLGSEGDSFANGLFARPIALGQTAIDQHHRLLLHAVIRVKETAGDQWNSDGAEVIGGDEVIPSTWPVTGWKRFALDVKRAVFVIPCPREIRRETRRFDARKSGKSFKQLSLEDIAVGRVAVARIRKGNDSRQNTLRLEAGGGQLQAPETADQQARANQQ